MGASIALLASQGHDILLLDLTNGEPTPFGDPVTRAREAGAAAACLSPSRPLPRHQLGLTNRRVEHTLEARHKLAAVIRAHQAQVVFAPYPIDAHPDHVAATRIVEDARFDAKLTKLDLQPPSGMTLGPPIYPRWLFYYYASHLRIVPDPSFILDVAGFEDHKMSAIRAYHSQFGVNPANAAVLNTLEASLRYFGSRINSAAGEPFFTREPLGLSSLDSLPI